MTFHSKAATNDVYDLFNQPLKCEAPKDDTQSAGESDIDDDGYSTAGESTGTGMISGAVSESGNEDTSVSVRTTMTMTGDEETSNGTVNTAETGGEWTEFSTSKHIPPQNLTGYQDSDEVPLIQHVDNTISNMAVEHAHPEEELSTPIEPEVQVVETKANTRFVPIPPEDYDPAPLRTFRDPSDVAQSRLPFMTPIVEKTESSLAANTAYQKGERDYFTVRTPSRSSSSKNDSPSKIGVDGLLLSSPFAENASPHRSGGKARSTTQLDFPVSPSPKSKRASRGLLEEQEDDLSSPRKKLQITRVHGSPTKIKVKATTAPSSPTTANHENGFVKPAIPTQTTIPAKDKSPIITDLQCNPTDPSIRNQILANVQPPLSSYTGFFNHLDHNSGRYTQLQKYAKKVQDSKIKSSPRKTNDKTSTSTSTTQPVPPILSFTSASRVYAVKRELGQGAFAPVYLVDSYDPDRPVEDSDPNQPSDYGSESQEEGRTRRRGKLEAIKAESPPSQAIWEFHIIRTIHRRLLNNKNSNSRSQDECRALESIITAHELHAFADEAYLVLDFCPTGTLLDLINLVRADNKRAGKAAADAAGLDEVLAMFFTVELLRTVESLHRAGILHGDLKGDNCLVRLPYHYSNGKQGLDLGAYAADGSNGWAGVGITLIDFGRGIDVTDFGARVGFIADWAAGATDAPEIRDARPWVWQLDLWAAAGVLHSLLWGRYIDTVPINQHAGGAAAVGAAGKKKYRLKEAFKRYWQGDIWGQVFEVLLNPSVPGSTATDDVQSLFAEMARVRELLELFLECEGERKGLRALIRRVDGLVGSSSSAAAARKR